jgi:hypothetical protein
MQLSLILNTIHTTDRRRNTINPKAPKASNTPTPGSGTTENW